jgi:hypothetical protein
MILHHVSFSNIFNIIHMDLKTLPVQFEHQPIYFLVDAFQPGKKKSYSHGRARR